MHEFSIAQAIIRTAVDSGARQGARRIRQINCRVGVLRQVVPELLQTAFEAQIADTPAAGAKLVLETVPLRFSCGVCGHTFGSDEWQDCPACGSSEVTLRGGDELVVSSIEIDDDGSGQDSDAGGAVQRHQKDPS